MHGSCGKAGTHIEGDRLMPRFIILLSLMVCVAVATIVSGPRPVHAANNVLKFGRSYWDPGSYETSSSMSAPSNALPRFRTL